MSMKIQNAVEKNTLKIPHLKIIMIITSRMMTVKILTKMVMFVLGLNVGTGARTGLRSLGG